jgi:inorganic pyrophosphatase
VHFFEHYKELEKDKWVKVQGWADSDKAKELIMAAIRNKPATR